MRRHTSALLSLTVVAVGVGASCTSQESATPSIPVAGAASTSTSTPTTSTTSVPEDEPGSTDVPATDPDDTVPVSEVPATDPPLATTPPPSGRPTSSATEYFAGGDQDGWLYLGRWTGNAWERTITDDGVLLEPTIRNGTEVVIHEVDVEPIDGEAGASAEACTNGTTGPAISPNARAPEDPGFGYRSVAFEADWLSAPRPAALVDASIDRYVTSGRTAFSDTGVDTASGAIEQLLVTDLDGDGDSESLVAFEGSSFAALLLIDADSGSGLTVARSIAEISTPTTVAGATETTLEAPQPTIGPFARFRTLAVADLNGDGLAEFVVHSWQNASDATVTAYTYDGRDVTAVLTASC